MILSYNKRRDFIIGATMNTYDTNRNNNRNDWFDDDRKLVNETKKFCIPNHATLSKDAINVEDYQELRELIYDFIYRGEKPRKTD